MSIYIIIFIIVAYVEVDSNELLFEIIMAIEITKEIESTALTRSDKKQSKV